MNTELLKTTRLKNGYTQEYLAGLLNISTSYYQSIELGNRTPSLNLALRLREILGTSLDDLFPRQP